MLVKVVRPILVDANGQLIPPHTPIEVPENELWTRRLALGVCVRCEPVVVAEPEPEPVAEPVKPKRRTRRKKTE